MAFPTYNHPYQQHQQHQGVINSGHTHPTTSWNPTAPHLGSTFTSPEFHPHFPSSHQPSAPVGASPPGQMDTSSSYLPAYLLGGSPAPRSPNRQRPSPYYLRGQHASRVSDTNMTHGGGVGVRASPYTTDSSIRKLDKPAGPPIQSLYEHTASPVQSSTPLPLRTSPERRHLSFSGINTVNKFSGATPDISRMMVSPKARYTGLPTPTRPATGTSRVSPPSPPQIDPFYSQGEKLTSEDTLDECWVTVFGFPSSASAYILDQFSQYGTILKHEVVAEGNWMHIQYQTKLQAKKALSKNGKVFGSGVMVGVQQCVDKAVMGIANGTVPSAAVTHTAPRQTTIRPLTAAYQAASSGHEVVPSNPNTPQKSTGLLSRAMEYMFGW